MKILLDTHTLIWALKGSNRLPEKIQNLIIDENNTIYVSTISLWEIAIKHRKNPKLINFTAEEIREYSQKAGYIFLSLSVTNIEAFERLTFINNADPFDQMLISQSESNNMLFLTHDKKIADFNIGHVELY